MCRNITRLFNIDPPATESEVRAASIQFVRKVSGSAAPSRLNEATFGHAVEEIAAAVARLLDSLATNAPPADRLETAAKAKARSEKRFGA